MPRKKQSYNDLLAEYRKLAKRADQRLVRLEKLSSDKDFKVVKQWAYKTAVKDALQWGANPEKPRFNIAPPANKLQLQAKIQDIKNFLEKPTSTKKGIITVYQKRADTLNKNYGLNLSWSDVGNLFESKLYKKLSKKYGSGTTLTAIYNLMDNKYYIMEDIKRSKAIHVKTEDNDMIVDDAIKKATRYYKKDVLKLLHLYDDYKKK